MTSDDPWHPRVPTRPPPSPTRTVRYGDLRDWVELGAGETVTVYRAEALGRGEPMTVTAEQHHRPDGGVDPDLLERFEAAARGWTGVDRHRNVGRVLGWGTDPVCWIASEYPHAGTLADRTLPIDPAEALWVGLGVVRALDAAHDGGRTHLSLAPVAVGLHPSGEGAWDLPRVGDWARGHVSSGAHTRSAYAAPEQSDRGPTPDERTDVFRAGAVLYEAFTGVTPRGSTHEVAPPTEIQPGLPEQVDPVLAGAIAADPSDRYRSIGGLREDLEAMTGLLGAESTAGAGPAGAPPPGDGPTPDSEHATGGGHHATAGRSSANDPAPQGQAGGHDQSSRQSTRSQKHRGGGRTAAGTGNTVAPPGDDYSPPSSGIDRRQLLILGGLVGSVGIGALVLESQSDTTPTEPGETQSDVPRASFDFEYDSTTDAVEIAHNGGERFTTENTGELRYGIPNRNYTFQWQLPVAVADRVTLEPVQSGDRVQVIWEAPDGAASRSLGSYRVP